MGSIGALKDNHPQALAGAGTGVDSAETEWDKIGPSQARNAARAYAALGAHSRAQRASIVASAAYTLTVTSLAGMVVRRGPITAVVGTESDYRRLARFRALFVAATGIALAILLNITVPAAYRFVGMVVLELILVGLIAAMLPSHRFHRSRGLRLHPRTWKRSHGVRQTWVLYALIHVPEITADELEASMRSLVPDILPGWAAVVFTTTDVQVQALQRLGFGRDSENSGLMYRTAVEARSSAGELPAPS